MQVQEHQASSCRRNDNNGRYGSNHGRGYDNNYYQGSGLKSRIGHHNKQVRISKRSYTAASTHLRAHNKVESKPDEKNKVALRVRQERTEIWKSVSLPRICAMLNKYKCVPDQS